MTVLVGLMSGTSLDGISAAVVRFSQPGPTPEGRVTSELLAFVSRPYTAAQRDRLADALTGATPEEYTRLDFDLGAWLADAAVAAVAEAGIARSDIAAICSHGHTVWHDPPRATWQFGNAAVIAERMGIPVISDFRSRDIAAGGQGAPLVTIADAMLFSAPAKWRATLNLGGIANVQLIPPGGELASVRAFDTGPGVGVIDAVVRTLVPSLAYDADGALSRRGTPIATVVDDLLRATFFSAPPPKSTGRELFTAEYVARFMAACRTAKA
ncbi:MAG: anhydro-N-acetylmuramic acid kinase, partial [Gemmatimonadales bacterium]